MASEKLSTLLHADTEKTAPVNADEVPILDSADSFKFAKVTWANVKATLATYFDTLYSAIGHTHSGVYEPVDATILKQADVDDTPVNGVTTAPVSSNWAYDHAALTEAHGISSFGASLVDDADAGTARTTLGLGTAATTASTDYAGAAHNHFGVYEPAGSVSTHAATTSLVHGISAYGASLVDDTDAAAARATLVLGTAAVAAIGDFATAAQGGLAATALQPGGALGTPASGTLTNCTGYPIPAVKLDDAAAPDDNTDLNASATAHGLLPKLANTGTKYLRDDGTWQTISSGDVVGPSSSTDNTIPRFDSTTGKLIQGSVAILGDDGTFYLEGIAGQTTGNARGAGAIDLQTSRDSASKVASGTNSVALGFRNTASGTQSFAVGSGNVASGLRAASVGGIYSTASGMDSFVTGTTNTASGSGAMACGSGAISANASQFSVGGCGYSGAGIGQSVVQPMCTTTTDNTPTVLNIALGATNRPVIAAKRVWVIVGTVAAISDATDGYKTKGWEIKAILTRDNSNSTRIIGTPTITVLGNDTEAAGWSVDSITADDTNESLAINVTGEAATTIKWAATLVYTQAGH